MILSSPIEISQAKPAGWTLNSRAISAEIRPIFRKHEDFEVHQEGVTNFLRYESKNVIEGVLHDGSCVRLTGTRPQPYAAWQTGAGLVVSIAFGVTLYEDPPILEGTVILDDRHLTWTMADVNSPILIRETNDILASTRFPWRDSESHLLELLEWVREPESETVCLAAGLTVVLARWVFRTI